jgi:hypothetical protein
MDTKLKNLEDRLIERADRRLVDDVNRLVTPVTEFLATHTPTMNLEIDATPEEQQRSEEVQVLLARRRQVVNELFKLMVDGARNDYRERELADFTSTAPVPARKAYPVPRGPPIKELPEE